MASIDGRVPKTQDFRCAGCGLTKYAKLRVKPEEMDLPVASPTGWKDVAVVDQVPEDGSLVTLILHCCSDACVAGMAAGKLPDGTAPFGITTVLRLRSAFTDDEGDDDDDEGEEVKDPAEAAEAVASEYLDLDAYVRERDEREPGFKLKVNAAKLDIAARPPEPDEDEEEPPVEIGGSPEVPN